MDLFTSASERNRITAIPSKLQGRLEQGRADMYSAEIQNIAVRREGAAFRWSDCRSKR